MRVRMLPISFVFSRFPRMVRDLAQRLGKEVNLVLTGEHTELDKTVLEKIGDPLVHLVRNSVDHGIEMPDVRKSNGKPVVRHAQARRLTPGRQYLRRSERRRRRPQSREDPRQGPLARHRRPQRHADGPAGLRAHLHARLLDRRARPPTSPAAASASTSCAGTSKNWAARSKSKNDLGKGARFIITLPLTLAIVDGQSIAVGKQNYIVPLISIIESLQIKQGALNRVAGQGEVFSFRGDYVPVIRLHEIFGVEPRAHDLHQGLIVIVEGDGRRVGLFVDDLLGQQQVVIKSLETNYGHIDGVSGATILGDGSVALILDLPGIIRRAGAGVRAN